MENHKNKNTPFILISFIISLILGVISFFIIKNNRAVHPDQILNTVKEKFRKDGPIEGSWVEMTKVPWLQDSHKREVYYGGLSRFEKNKIKHYEFIADAHSAELIDLYEI